MDGEGPSRTAAFEEHASWVRSLREYSSLQNQQLPSPTRVETSFNILTRTRDVEQLSGSDPFRGELLRGEESLVGSFDLALDLDEAFEAPVYRGLGLAAFQDALDRDSDAQEVGHEPPVYRSLGGLDGGAFDSDDDGDSWPESMPMPPLVQRQRAGTLNVGTAFGDFGFGD